MSDNEKASKVQRSNQDKQAKTDAASDEVPSLKIHLLQKDDRTGTSPGITTRELIRKVLQDDQEKEG